MQRFSSGFIPMVLLSPTLASADTPTSYAGLVDMLIGFINVLIPAMFAVVFIIIVWRVIDAWILHAGDPAKREEGRRMAITAIIVMVVAVSVWGIVQMIRRSFFGW